MLGAERGRGGRVRPCPEGRRTHLEVDELCLWPPCTGPFLPIPDDPPAFAKYPPAPNFIGIVSPPGSICNIFEAGCVFFTSFLQDSFPDCTHPQLGSRSGGQLLVQWGNDLRV